MERTYTTPLLDKLGVRPGMRVALMEAAGLIDDKVAAFSSTHTALRLVIPVARRPRAG